jgi:glycosyltransferase involved in cell wall biosynthesis
MKKILMLLQSEFPPDIRLEKEISTLHQNGYEVTLLCNHYDKSKTDSFKGCEIVRISAPFNSIKYNKAVNFPVFFNPKIVSAAIKVFKKFKPDFVHAHDLPMVPLALLLKKLYRVPVIYDMHENYPEALKYFDKKGIVNKIFKNPHAAAKLDEYCIKNSDAIITVVEENKERLIKKGIARDKIHVVSNTVDLETFASGNPDPEIIERYSSRFVLTYTGTVSPERGLETPVMAMKILKDKIVKIILLIIGDGPSVNHLQKLIADHKLEYHVKLLEWCGHNKLVSYLAASDICIIPQPNNDFINTTIPHKLFEYMSQSKPVIVSDAKPLKRIVEETKCGESFESNNPVSFSENVVKIYEDSSSYGENGRKGVETKYNWNVDAEILLELYGQLL